MGQNVANHIWCALHAFFFTVHLNRIVQLNSHEQLRFEALFWMASEGGSGLLKVVLGSRSFRHLRSQRPDHDARLVQSPNFLTVEALPISSFYLSIPELRAPRLKQKKVRLGFIKS